MKQCYGGNDVCGVTFIRECDIIIKELTLTILITILKLLYANFNVQRYLQ